MVNEYLGKFGGVVGEFALPRGYVFAPTYLQAGAIAILIFLLVLTLGQLRRRFVGWTVGGIMPGVAIGFSLAIILEGIFVVGGRTILTEVLGWEGAPKPIVNVLDAGRGKLVQVLGVSAEVPSSNAKEGATIDEIEVWYEALGEDEKREVQMSICPQ
jgi:hypothetical protein